MEEAKLIEQAVAYGSLVPYWAFAFATAASFYGGTRWVGAHFKPEFKSKLTHWLNGTYEDTWTAQFGRLFDTVFGEKHFSCKRLYRSAVASVLSVTFLYVLFAHVLGVMGERSFGILTFWQALLLGTAINIIPDYLSLIETRWLLHRFERLRSLPLQIGLLLIDLVFTAAIIFGAIYLYALVFIDGRAPSWVELIALFSPLAILFYSTFLTSIWAWLYCLSTWFIRLFTKLGLRRVLDVKADPVKQIALVGAALVLGGGLALGPAVSPEKGEFASPFDDMICEWDFGACVHAARISASNSETAVRAAHFMAKACANEADEGNCGDRLITYFEGNWSSIIPILDTACEAGFSRSCSSLGYAYSNGLGVVKDSTRAVKLYSRACDGGVAIGCYNLARHLKNGFGVEKDLVSSVVFFERTCRVGLEIACAYFADALINGTGVSLDLNRATSIYQRLCESGNLALCVKLGLMFEIGTEYLPRLPYLLRRKCGERGVLECEQYLRSYHTGYDENIDLPRALRLYRQACYGGYELGCRYLGLMYHAGSGVDINLPRALKLYQQACKRPNSRACNYAVKLKARLDDQAE